jgi:hypothetical protein
MSLPPPPPRAELDAARHYLASQKFETGPNATILRWLPIPLDEAAQEARENLETGAEAAGKPLGDGIVVIPPGHASAIAGLLEDLAQRLKPGVDAGPIQSDGSYSALARELSNYMHRLANP